VDYSEGIAITAFREAMYNFCKILLMERKTNVERFAASMYNLLVFWR